ncbi:MAG: ATP-binding protein [Rhodospirillaceae bacterium]|nr:ATP-binding protein [Rhodospirillaceae bacterium]
MDENAHDDMLELSLVNDLQEIGAAAARIDAFCEQREITSQIAYAVNLSIDEILTNTISYGYDDDEQHRIGLSLSMEGDVLVIEIVDDGRAFDSSLERDPDIDASLEERSLGGLGLFLVQQLMDDVKYQRRDELNVITLRKNTAEQAGQ